MYHYRKTHKRYAHFSKPLGCAFCDQATMRQRAVLETEYAYVVPNRTFYDVWELKRVVDHLLVVPKQHVSSLSALIDIAKADIMTLYGQYEQTDYNVYARAVTNQRRSVAHQHTHLIKTENRSSWLFLHIRKPYFTLKF